MFLNRLFSVITFMLISSFAIGQIIDFGTVGDETKACGQDGYSFSFQNKSTLNGNDATYKWDFGDGGILEEENPTYVYEEPGTYSVKLVVKSKTGDFIDSLTKTNYILLGAKPKADFVLQSTEAGCAPHHAYFRDTTEIGDTGILSYLWDFGNGSSSTEQHPTAIYTKSVAARVVLVVTDSLGCTDKHEKRFEFDVTKSVPVVNTTIDAPLGCETPHCVSYTDSSYGNGPLTFKWDFGDSTDDSTSTEMNPSHCFQDTGMYTTTLLITDSLNCSSYRVYNEYVKIRFLTAEYYADTLSLCNSMTYVFSDSSSEYANAWVYDYGDGTLDSSQHTQHTFEDTTQYQTILTVTDDYNCVEKDTIVINVELAVAANFDTTKIRACQDTLTYQFTDRSKNAVSWLWDFGDGQNSTDQHPIHFYADQGNYTVSLSVTDSNGCQHSMTVENKIQMESFNPVLNVGTYPYCTPALLFLDATTPSPQTWDWSIDDTIQFNTQNISYTFRDSGNYQIQLKVNGVFCSDSTDTILNIAAPPTIYADFVADTTFKCDTGLTVNFRDTSKNAVTWLWDFGNGQTSFEQYPTVFFEDSGVYTISLTVSDTDGCVDQLIRNDFIEVRKAFKMLPAEYNCDSPLTLFFGDSSINSNQWLWEFGDGSNSNEQNPSHTYASKGEYIANLTIADSLRPECNATFKDTFFVGGLNPSINVDSLNCYGDSIEFIATTDNPLEYLWDFGDGTTDTLSSPKHFFDSIGTYDVQLIVRGSKCVDTTTQENLTILAPISRFNKDLNCENPLIVSFTDSSAYASGHTWNFGDGNARIEENPVHEYQNNGEYIVSLTTTNGACTHTVYDTLSIQVMVIDFEVDTIQCWGDSIVFTDQSFAAQEFHWDFGDGNTSEKRFPKNFYEQPDTYQVRLITTANQICKDTMEKRLIIQSPKPQYQLIRNCINPYELVFKDSSIDASSINWQFEDTTASQTDTLVAYTYPDTGWFELTMTATNSETGCTTSIVDSILISDVRADFKTSDSVVCFDTPIDFLDLSEFATDWYWTFDTSAIDSAIEQNPTYTYTELGKFDVKLMVTDSFGCIDSIIKPELIEVLGPKTKFTDLHDCVDFYSVQFSDSSIDAESYFWKFGDGISSTNQEPSHTYSTLGEYIVSLTTVNNSNNCSHTYHKRIYLFIPEAEFTSSATITCEKSEVNFLDRSAYPQTHQWYFGDGTESIEQNPDKSYENEGLYDVKLVYQDINGCMDSVTKNDYIKVNSNPTASYVTDTNGVCLPHDIVFTSTSITDTPIVQYTWLFGDGGTSSLETPTRSYGFRPTQLDYNIELRVKNANGCTDVLSVPKGLQLGSPNAIIAGERYFCVGDEVDANSFSQGYGLSNYWDFGDGTTSNDYSPTKSYDSTGEYTLNFIITDTLGCTDTLIDSAYYIISNPVANFYTNDSTSKYCPTLLVNFLDNSEDIIANYYWDFGDSSGLGLGPHVSHLYTAVGNYDVKLVVETQGGCKDSITKEDFITITGPTAELEVVQNPAYGCKPLTVDFEVKNLVNVDSFFLNYDDGDTFDVVLNHVYDEIGVFVPQIWVTQRLNENETCTYLIPSKDTIRTAIVKALYNMNTPNEGCPPLTAEFIDASIDASSWEWIFGDGNVDTVNQSPTHIYENSGDYDVRMIVKDDQGCTDTLLVEHGIDAFDIEALFSVDTVSGCSPFEVVFHNESTSEARILDWSWNFGNDSTASNPLDKTTTYTSETFTMYTPQLTILDANGCEQTFKDTIDLYLYPKVDFESNVDTICPLEPLELTNTTPDLGGDTYRWYFQETDSSVMNATTSYGFKNVGLQDLQLTVTSEYGCDSTLVKRNAIYVFNYPDLEVRKGVEIGQGQSTNLLATGVREYEWEPAEFIDDPSSSNPLVTPTDTTVFYVTGTDSNQCIKTDSVTIVVKKSIESAILFPGAFSPNADGINDTLKFVNFQIDELSYFTIFNQWGQVVFETGDINKGWDGKRNDKEQPIGTYAYVVAGFDKKGEPLTIKGTFSLIR